MNVLFISSGNRSNYPDRSGIVVYNQGKSLIKTRLNLDYFLIQSRGLKGYLQESRSLKKYLKNNQPDIFHAHYSLSALTAVLAGCRPLIVSLMGSDIKSNSIWKIFIRFLNRFYFRAIIVKSSSMKKYIGLKRAVIIPNGVDLEVVKPALEDTLNFKNRPIILFAADPGRYAKNFQLARKAVSLLDDERIVFKVVHSQSHKMIINEINNANVLLVTSRWEGSPNIIKEAMSCNCPVVATDVGDIRWLFGNEPGYFITGFDPEDVADKIKQALEFSEKYGRTNGRKRIIELGLDSETVAKRIVRVYEDVLEREKRRKRNNKK